MVAQVIVWGHRQTGKDCIIEGGRALEIFSDFFGWMPFVMPTTLQSKRTYFLFFSYERGINEVTRELARQEKCVCGGGIY